MYLRILKKDLKRKKTMNIILLIFIILAATFIASSANNMVSVVSALDKYFAKANVPDYWLAMTAKEELGRFEDFARKNHYKYGVTELLQIDAKNVIIEGEEKRFVYSNTLCLSALDETIYLFDSEDKRITQVQDGEIYVTAELFYKKKYHLKQGGKIKIWANGRSKTFTIKGCMKDAEFGSAMMGQSRMLISERDLAYFHNEQAAIQYSIGVYTDDSHYTKKYSELNLNTIMSADYATIKMMYIMDMLIAGIMLLVSVCLILISMVILRFTIQFTMSEEFREIGVMKAIGIPDRAIRGLYAVKYLVVSVAGAVIGFWLSIPFGELLLQDVSRNIILSGSEGLLLNLLCAAGTAAVVVLLSYFCTRKIKQVSPIDAVRSGENGERYSKKGMVHLAASRALPVPFMAVNDIFCSIRRFVSMLIIFTLGLLLIIIPINVINTLQSDKLIKWFNMADCNHVIVIESIFYPGVESKQNIEKSLTRVTDFLKKEEIEAKVFQEIVFRMNISHGNKRTSSLAFQGNGEVTAEQYDYMKGTAPQNRNEVAVTGLVAERIGAAIGDNVVIWHGDREETYIVTALFQSMNNMGEGIRFYQEEELDYGYAAGCFGIQIKYKDSPDKALLAERKSLLKRQFKEYKVYTAGEYVNYMVGDIAGQLQGIKQFILLIVLGINILVTVLMVKSFITKERGEIAMLKAIGFRNFSLISWQTLRIGMVLLAAVLLAVCVSTPLTKLSVEPIFQMMGAQSIKFYIKPLEVYGFYPLVVLCVTVLAGMLSACQVIKISASEISNIE